MSNDGNGSGQSNRARMIVGSSQAEVRLSQSKSPILGAKRLYLSSPKIDAISHGRHQPYSRADKWTEGFLVPKQGADAVH